MLIMNELTLNALLGAVPATAKPIGNLWERDDYEFEPGEHDPDTPDANMYEIKLNDFAVALSERD